MARKQLLLAAAAFMALSLPLGAQVILDETKIVVPTYLVGDPEVDLVVDNAHYIMIFAYIYHCFDKVLAVNAKHPSDTHNKILIKYF